MDKEVKIDSRTVFGYKVVTAIVAAVATGAMFLGAQLERNKLIDKAVNVSIPTIQSDMADMKEEMMLLNGQVMRLSDLVSMRQDMVPLSAIPQSGNNSLKLSN